jgi:predicted metal-dependent HD superfamily phosphohydrolase
MLKELFFSVTNQYSNNAHLQQKLWAEIEKNYTGKKRHYHNLNHLENLFEEVNDIKHAINNWNAVVLAIFYHDAVYKAYRKDNEEQSEALAEKHLNQVSCNKELIEQVTKLILATKSHQVSGDDDVNLFTDADLSILGKDWQTYQAYCSDVRKEYTIYPDFLYKPGRKKVQQHFLAMERIFKTEHFYSKYEIAARSNMEREISFL